MGKKNNIKMSTMKGFFYSFLKDSDVLVGYLGLDASSTGNAINEEEALTYANKYFKQFLSSYYGDYKFENISFDSEKVDLKQKSIDQCTEELKGNL